MKPTVLLAVLLTALATVHSQYLFPSTKRIVGGSDAGSGDYPYLASLRNRYDNHFCGGSIIGKKWILTAAHCVYSASERSISVVMGILRKDDDGLRRKVQDIILHSDLNTFQWVPDVALLKLHNPIIFTDYIQPIALQTSELRPGTSAVLVGFGDLRLRGPSPKHLQYLDVETVSWNTCKKAHKRKVLSSHICTFTRDGEGACHGDSGGPLVSHGKQIGVVSWGKPCAVGKPDVFAKVAAFADWIKEKMGEEDGHGVEHDDEDEDDD